MRGRCSLRGRSMRFRVIRGCKRCIWVLRMRRRLLMLKLRDVTCGYGRTAVVHGVDLEVGADDVTAVLGHNGAGKTTLLRAVVGLIPVMSGSVEFDGETINRKAANKRVKAGIA